MPDASAPSNEFVSDRPGRRSVFGLSWAPLGHVLIWGVGPALLIGNLHADTLEAIYWGANWALGYDKHPPVTTWILDAALQIGGSPILNILIASQATVAIAAYFVWRTARLFRGPVSAALALSLFLITPTATFYAVQVNHNIMLAPFWAAAMFFGLRYLEERRPADSIALGVAAGLGLVTKYEILFILAALVAAAALIRRYRRAFVTPASYWSLGVMALIAAPHVWWLSQHGWPSVSRAIGVEKMISVETLNLSAVNALIGQFTLFAAPMLLLLVFQRWRAYSGWTNDRGVKRLGALLAFGPSLILLAGAAATDQIVKPLWVLPLAPSAAVGLALIFPADEMNDAAQRVFARVTVASSLVVFASFFGYLLLADAIGKPVTAYEPHAERLAEAVENDWRRHQTRDLACIIVADRKLGPSPLLWLRPMPRVVDYSSGFWHGPRKIARCLESGGMIVDASSDHEAEKAFPRACVSEKRVFNVHARFGLKGGDWPVDLIYVPPAGQGCGT